MHHGAVIVKH